MNQEKIGKLIYNLRKKHSLTQADLASRLSVTPQAISKWENGRGIPDLDLLKKISEEFKIDISYLLNIENKTKKRNYIIIFITIFLIALLSTSFYFINKKDDFNFSTLTSNNEEFSVSGVAAYSNDKKSIYISNIEYKNPADKETKYTAMECILYEQHKETEEKISQCGNIDSLNEKKYTLSELLDNVTLTVNDYSKNCKDLEKHKLYLIINAKNSKKQIITYKIPLNINGTCSN